MGSFSIWHWLIVLVIVLLIFGVSWQKKYEPAVQADLWSSLPPIAPPKVTLPPPMPEPPLAREVPAPEAVAVALGDGAVAPATTGAEVESPSAAAAETKLARRKREAQEALLAARSRDAEL